MIGPGHSWTLHALECHQMPYRNPETLNVQCSLFACAPARDKHMIFGAVSSSRTANVQKNCSPYRDPWMDQETQFGTRHQTANGGSGKLKYSTSFHQIMTGGTRIRISCGSDVQEGKRINLNGLSLRVDPELMRENHWQDSWDTPGRRCFMSGSRTVWWTMVVTGQVLVFANSSPSSGWTTNSVCMAVNPPEGKLIRQLQVRSNASVLTMTASFPTTGAQLTCSSRG